MQMMFVCCIPGMPQWSQPVRPRIRIRIRTALITVGCHTYVFVYGADDCRMSVSRQVGIVASSGIRYVKHPMWEAQRVEVE